MPPDIHDTDRLIAFLSQYLTESRRGKMQEVLARRTRHLTVVLEDIYQPHNASAVIRSCDCFGIQDLYIIENSNTYRLNPDVALGSSQWVNLIRYNRPGEDNTAACIRTLHEKGYRIAATSPHRFDYTIATMPVDRKTALLFGTEKRGLSEQALKEADLLVSIPMSGFTESLNLSVCAAVCLYELTGRLRNSGIPWRLGEEEKKEILLHWLRETMPEAEKEFYVRKNK